MSQVGDKKAGQQTLQLKAGIKSGCWVPLNTRGEIVGTLFVGSRGKLLLTNTRQRPFVKQPARSRGYSRSTIVSEELPS